ncbi:MAG TPA: hypothetical protein VMS43_10905 [Allosphingosinicella sp.]|nr:hypothetical protein [Allosphingosinicella sp.]
MGGAASGDNTKADKDIFDSNHEATQKYFEEHGTVESKPEKPHSDPAPGKNPTAI